MSRLILSIAAALGLSACAGLVSYITVLESWAGAPEEELVREWGTPLRTSEAGGRRTIVFEARRVDRHRSTLSDGDVNVKLSCTTTFELENGRVVEWTHRGNDCSPRESAFRGSSRSVAIIDEGKPGAPARVRVGGGPHAAGCGLLTPDDLAELGMPADLRNTHSIEKGDGLLVCRFDPASGKLPSVTLLFARGGEDKIDKFRTAVKEKARKASATQFFMPDGFCEVAASPLVAVVQAMTCTAATEHAIVTLAVLTSGSHTRPLEGAAEREQRVMQGLLERVRARDS